ncbi:hypothetical protein ACX3YG_08850 [Pseudomonas wadenswilerensis]
MNNAYSSLGEMGTDLFFEGGAKNKSVPSFPLFSLSLFRIFRSPFCASNMSGGLSSGSIQLSGEMSMNEKQRLECSQISSMSSEEAAEWLMSQYPVDASGYGEVFVLIPHRSWKRAEQQRLASYYLQKMPFAAGKAYDSLASVMPVRVLLDAASKYVPNDPGRIDLLLYYLVPVLSKRVRSQRDFEVLESFLSMVDKNKVGLDS